LGPIQKDNFVAKYLVQAFDPNWKPDRKKRGTPRYGPGEVLRLTVTEAGYLLSGIKLWDPRAELKVSHKVFALMRKKVPPKGAWPLTRRLVEGVAGGFVALGAPRGGLGVMFAFSTLLRVGELLKVGWEHLYLPDDLNTFGTVYLSATKAGESQWVPITDLALIRLLRSLKAELGNPTTGPVFPLTYDAFRRLFRSALTLCRLSLEYFRTHSLRRGGATLLLQETRSVEEVMLVGRWRSLSSARLYLRQGEALLANFLAGQNDDSRARVSALRKLAEDLFR
jgi:integrase